MSLLNSLLECLAELGRLFLRTLIITLAIGLGTLAVLKAGRLVKPTTPVTLSTPQQQQ